MTRNRADDPLAYRGDQGETGEQAAEDAHGREQQGRVDRVGAAVAGGAHDRESILTVENLQDRPELPDSLFNLAALTR